jgi:hypothetical protein
MVLTLVTCTLNRASTASAISSLVEAMATLNTTLLCSDSTVVFSVITGARMVS